MYADEVELPESYQIREDQRCKPVIMQCEKKNCTSNADDIY